MEVPDYELPTEAIAQRPAEPRDSARLLDATAGSADPAHRRVSDLPSLLHDGDVLVLNNSKVVPARLRLYKSTGGRAEVLLLEPDRSDAPSNGDTWTALVRPGRRLPPGTSLSSTAGGPAAVQIGERIQGGRRKVRFVEDPDKVIADCGELALPPYITTPLVDPQRYQTVYAEHPGSVAAPTAGLHLTPDLLDSCRAAGAQVVSVDLSIGAATFRPITVDRAEDHVMHAEHYRVPQPTWEACLGASRVVAVGTTTVRALESAAGTGALEGASDLYICGDFGFAVVDVLMTNFHAPRSSLLVLLEAFCGRGWRDIYSTALRDGYRFLSFGDAMLVARQADLLKKEPRPA